MLKELLRPTVRRFRAARMARKRRSGHPVTPGGGHDLPGELIVSLTSYPKRFGNLDLTLKSLLRQNIPADRILLWIAHADRELLPAVVRRLNGKGVEICVCADTRQYKKLVPALAAFPDAVIVTADDDVFYPPEWLAELVRAYQPAQPTIVCHRAHRLSFESDGSIAPYRSWTWDVQDEAARRPSTDLLPTGVAGVLYPPASLSPDVLDVAAFMKLAPSNDDLWFYWMARKRGTRVRKVGGVFALECWPGSQDEALFDVNGSGGNDQQIAALQADMPLDTLGSGPAG